MIRILVDSSCDYFQSEAAEIGVDLIPLVVTIDGVEYRDGIGLDRDEFYSLAESAKEFPKTSVAPIAEYVKYFLEAKEAGDDVIAITLSSGLSSTYEHVQSAAELAGCDKARVIDSLGAPYMVRFLVDEAVSLRDSGADAAQIEEALKDLRGKIQIAAGLDTLEYLARGGRLNKAAAKVGDVAKVKPVICFGEGGTVKLMKVALGRKKALDAVVKHVCSFDIDERYPFHVLYSCGDENALKFKARLEEAGVKVDDVLQIGSTIGAHIGPKAFGATFVTKSC